jgi:hypothetical protein
MAAFANWLSETAGIYQIALHAWALMIVKGRSLIARYLDQA